MRLVITALSGIALTTAPALAQIRTVDPNMAAEQAAQADVTPGERGYQVAPTLPPPPTPASDNPSGPITGSTDNPGAPATPAPDQSAPTSPVARQSQTWKKDDLIGAAEGVFGKGAAGLAGIIEKILGDQGEPNAYIAGREASGAIGIGLRYGSGTMQHKVEGQRPVYWTGPSLGFDLGGDATKVFTLVYNLYDSQEIYRRYPQIEGRMYYVGGFSATYMRRGSVVLIPVRLGVGVRLGANIGYMKFSEKSRWLPF